MSYNFLRNARSIKNSPLCRYDTLNGYASSLDLDGDFDGWDVYDEVYLYGSWNGTLFGTADDRDCYISRTNTLAPVVAASRYYYIELVMKITDNNRKAVGGLTTGRIQWVTINDPLWDTDKQVDFDLINDDKWHVYRINVGPESKWVGYVNNLRIHPFIDGWSGDQFTIKSIKITSNDDWVCTNTQCSYYTSYEHPCPGAGRRANLEAGTSNTFYTTISGISDKLIVNIDGYGNEEFELGTNINLNGVEMARVVTNALGVLNMGSYAFAECEYSDFDKLKITSGTVGSDSSVTILYSAAAEALGFYDGTTNISTHQSGINQATKFDYAASRLFRPFEINKLIDGYIDEQAYVHNPHQFATEGGRRDFANIGNSKLISNLSGTEYYENLNNKGRTIIDLSHPINNNGRLKAIYIFGKIKDGDTAKVKICRPLKNGNLKVIHSLTFSSKTAGLVYTSKDVSYRIDCDILVSKGDVIGVYNANLYVGVSVSGQPDATFYQYNGEASGTFDPGRIYALGVAGLSVYARSDRRQNNAILDIDMGNRINIEEVNIYGQEETSYFEFNIASCLDVDWDVELFNEYHTHYYINWNTGEPFGVNHNNIAYGEDALSDFKRTPDNGKVGDSYYFDNGLATAGEHSYFYVNGDAEWLYSYDGISEFNWPLVPYQTVGFVRDPIAFTLLFPNESEIKIHKSIMYFKEDDNFRKFALSYYLGSSNATGNADDRHFNYIPSYNSIRLDGLLFDSTNNENIIDYLFNNPSSDDALYSDGELINESAVKQSHATWWNTIEHNFSPIKCKGFRIYCNKHHSTKINELEVYSRVRTDASLVDNISMTFSDDGEIYKSADFEEIETSQVSAFVGGAPRYFRLEMESGQEFTINEIAMSVSNQLKLPTCETSVLLNNAKTNEISEATPLIFENVYDRPFDLIIDLPKETSETNNLIFWSRFDSLDDIENPDVGPACFLYKEDNYDLLNMNGQCAINDPTYGLINLVHGKESYEIVDLDLRWTSLGTLSSGVSIDFCNSDYKDIKKTSLNIDVDSSGQYWKVGLSYFNPPTAGIVATYLGDISGSSFIDSGPNNYHGSTYGNPSEVVSDEVEGNLIYFDGNDDIELMTHAEASTFENEFSVSLFFKCTTTVGHGAARIISRDISDYFGLRIDQSTSFPQELLFYDNTTTHNLGSIIQPDILYHVVMMFDVANQISRCYLDGTLLYEDLSWGGFDATSRPLALASNVEATTQHNNQFTGYIGDVRFFNYLLSEEEIRNLKYVVANLDSIVVYKNSDRLDIDRVYVESTNDANSQTNVLISDGLNIPLSYENQSFGFRLAGGPDTITKVVMYHSPTTVTSGAVRVSPNNGNNYVIVGSSKVGTYSNNNWYQYFAIDLEHRHNIDIIRNYGNATNKLLINKETGVEYSNTETSDPDSVVWDNSDYTDARWMRIKLLCGDGVTRCIRKLGIYPDILQNSTPDSAYNCEWQSLGTILTNYDVPINVAYGATVTGTNYYFSTWYPTNAVDGIHDDYSALACWGFQKEPGADDPYIELDFGQTYTINKIVLYHGYNPGIDDYMNTDYTFSVSASTSGSFSNVFSISGNSSHTRTHQFDSVQARRARLTITGYDRGDSLSIYDPATNQFNIFLGSFLREIEVYTYEDNGYIDSETWPIVCINLKEPFNVSNHTLINKDPSDTSTNWSNDDQFFYYSGDYYDDPQKVAFKENPDSGVVYSAVDSSGNAEGETEYLFTQNLFLEEGIYLIEWDAYDADSDDEISLRFDGPEVLDHFADNLGGGTWVAQSGYIQITEEGNYDLKGMQHLDFRDDWGVRNPVITKFSTSSKWVAIKRDTATNYSYDDDSGKYGIDYLETAKMFVNDTPRPTEYYWWWGSNLSTLSNDSLNVKVGSRSLKIRYPTSSGVDTLQFIEGDNFGIDNIWSVKDVLQFWLKISNVGKLDTSFGDITFGSINRGDPFYYVWNISDLNLQTGWNLVKLKFDDYADTFPEPNDLGIKTYLEDDLDLRNNDKNLKSLRIRFRGKGQPFNMYMDDLHIERNVFEDTVQHGKGLHLNGHELLQIPVAGLTLERGAVEFWLKTYYDSYGQDMFNNTASKTFFTITNNNNDIVSLGLRGGNWFEAIVGNIRSNLNRFNAEFANFIEGNFVNVGEVIHLALAWSHDSAFMDNDHTLRLYLNGELIYASTTQWEVSDTKSVHILLGGKSTQLAFNQESYGSGIFDNIKVYNYPKDVFHIYEEGVERDIIYTPNDFLEISSDNVSFYGANSDQLPIIFEQVPAGGSRTIYLRSNKNDNFAQSKKTANLVVQWLTTV